MTLSLIWLLYLTWNWALFKVHHISQVSDKLTTSMYFIIIIPLLNLSRYSCLCISWISHPRILRQPLVYLSTLFIFKSLQMIISNIQNNWALFVSKSSINLYKSYKITIAYNKIHTLQKYILKNGNQFFSPKEKFASKHYFFSFEIQFFVSNVLLYFTTWKV